MSKKWFTSDLHFHHKNIVKFTERGQDTTQELHDQWLIDLWNSQVAKGDMVYHLGDFSFSRDYELITDIVSRLNGQKVFIQGNHCDRSVMGALWDNEWITSVKDYKEIKVLGNKTILFHYPIASWNQQARGSWHLHGHCHGSFKDVQGKRLDVGLDNAFKVLGSHRFFSEEDIKTYMDAQSIYVADHHKEIK